MKKVGGTRQYLVIDLARENWRVDSISHSIYQKYLGGESLGKYLWSLFTHTNNTVQIDPLCFVAGALCGSTFPCSDSLSVVGRSYGGQKLTSYTTIAKFSQNLVSCGWNAIILIGIARRPMVLRIGPTEVEFRTSERLIGKSISETYEALHLSSGQQAVCIGPAGEQRVHYASMVSDHTILDRGGFGARLGEKQVKALVIESGPYRYDSVHEEKMESLRTHVSSILSCSPYVRRVSEQGLLDVVSLAMKEGFAPVDNFTGRTDPRMIHLTHEELKRKCTVETEMCGNCPLCCKKRVRLPSGDKLVVPDGQTFLALGPNIGNFEIQKVLEWNRQCIEFGINPLSFGVIVGWLLYASEKKVLPWDASLFLNVREHIGEILRIIAYGIGVGKELGKGLFYLQTQYGECDGFPVVGTQEMSPYDPRGAWGQSLLTGLAEDTPCFVEHPLGILPPRSTRAKAEWVVHQENVLSIARSIGVCEELLIPLVYERYMRSSSLRKSVWRLLFVFPKLAQKIVNVSILASGIHYFSGYVTTEEDLFTIARRSLYTTRTYNQEIDQLPLQLPPYFLIEPQSNDRSPAVVPYRTLADRYRLMRKIDFALIGGEKT